jgi:hypothetical protein
MRERLRESERPDRVFGVALDAAKAAGLVGKKRVLDSTPRYDAVATMDTITLIVSAIRSLLKLADAVRCVELRAVLSGDDYASSSKPQIDWDHTKAQQGLIDSRAKDGYALLALIQGRELEQAVSKAAALLATVLSQDLETGDDGTFRIARRLAPDRVISVVDPETRHGHKTSSRDFDGYKGHAAIDPDTEIITAVALSPGTPGTQEMRAWLRTSSPIFSKEKTIRSVTKLAKALTMHTTLRPSLTRRARSSLPPRSSTRRPTSTS